MLDLTLFQVMSTRSKFSAQKLIKGMNVKEQNHMGDGIIVMKPEGCIWTSSLNARGSSEWINWCSANMPNWIENFAVVFKLINNPKILEINKRNYALIAKKFPHVNKLGLDIMIDPKLDWNLISKQYDGVHVEPRHLPDEFYTWDVESTAWFRPSKNLSLVNIVDLKTCQKIESSPAEGDIAKVAKVDKINSKLLEKLISEALKSFVINSPLRITRNPCVLRTCRSA